MALQKNTVTVHGIKLNFAYYRVENVSIKGKETLCFYLRVYADKEKQFFQEQVFTASYNIAGDNPIKQAYEHLKTLPEFANATDC